VTVLDGLVYGTAVNSAGEEIELLIDVVLPAVDGDSRPTVVFVHGGSFAFGSRSEYRSEVLSWARAGWVAASVDYRLQSSEEAGAQPIAAAQAVQDVGDALRWLIDSADEYGIDPDRIVALGGSAGGFTVLSPWLGPAPAEIEVERFPPIAAVVSNGATLEGARPVIGLAADGPPVLLVQFETDRTAGEAIGDGHLTCNAIIAAGGVCEIEELPGEGHVVSLDYDGPHGPALLDFMRANLNL
jgi:poly(3-hydroxybutyrate) depolymerase